MSAPAAVVGPGPSAGGPCCQHLGPPATSLIRCGLTTRGPTVARSGCSRRTTDHLTVAGGVVRRVFALLDPLPDPRLCFTPIGALARLEAALLGRDRPRIEQVVGLDFRNVPLVADSVSQSGSPQMVVRRAGRATCGARPEYRTQDRLRTCARSNEGWESRSLCERGRALDKPRVSGGLRISRVLATRFHAKWPPRFAGNGHPVSRVVATPS